MTLKRNVIANYLGQGWRALMGFAFIPLYIKYLGMEAYGLIGIFALLQAWLQLLDAGMRPALAREMSRFTGGAHSSQSIRDLLRSIELISLAVAAIITIGIWTVSGWLAVEWITAERLSTETVRQAFIVMGCVIALRLVEGVYVSSIVGLQRQVLENSVSSILATIRGLGAVAVLAWISPSIGAYFLWQAFISFITVLVFAGIVRSTLPTPPRPAQFSIAALRGIWRFALGMMTIAFLALLLTQVDKLLLSRLLSLEGFAYYALATLVASTLHMLTAPITAAFYPKFAERVASGGEASLPSVYHLGAQLVTVITGPAAITLMLFGDKALLLWTSDPLLSERVSPLLTILALGTFLNAAMWIPYQMQLAYGWTSLGIKINVAAVTILVPAILWIVPVYGPIGAAWLWVTLNFGYIMFNIHFMHKRLLITEKWSWYFRDLIGPFITAFGVAGVIYWLMPQGGRTIFQALLLVGIFLTLLAAATLAAPVVRSHVAQRLITLVRPEPIKGT